MRLIDADALKAKYEQMLPEIGDGYHKETLQDVLFELDYAPTVSPDEVRGVGEWICDPISAVSPVEEWYCNICKQPAPMGYGKAYVRTNYCPNCGAKMEVIDE